MPEWAPVSHADEVELKARPLCAGVSVETTMRPLRAEVDGLFGSSAIVPYALTFFFMRHI
jgi:hypothetical protein